MIETFEVAVIDWAEKKGILAESSPLVQITKTQEEVEELIAEIHADDKDKIRLELGDVLVTLAIQAHMHGLCLGSCLAAAYHKINQRTGKMVDGVFVKDA